MKHQYGFTGTHSVAEGLQVRGAGTGKTCRGYGFCRYGCRLDFADPCRTCVPPYMLLGYSCQSWSHYPLWHTHPLARLEFWHVIPWSSASAPTLLKWMEYLIQYLAAWRPYMQSQPGLEVKIDEDKYIEVDEVVKGEDEHLAVLDSLISKWET